MVFGMSSRWLRGFVAVPVAIVFVGVALGAARNVQGDAGVADGMDPTYYADILPILKANCLDCHSPSGINIGGMVAPMSFTTYEETRRWAPIIAAAVEAGRMPPWDAAPEFRGVFHNERWIDDADKATLIAWARGGAPAGDPSTATVQIEQAELVAHGAGQAGHGAHGAHGSVNWAISEPDLILGFSQPFHVADDVDDLQLTVPVRVSAEDHPTARWIRQAQLIPGSHIVHHILAWPVAGVAHGVPPVDYPEGYGVLLPAGPLNIPFQMHYNKVPGPGTAVDDVSIGGVVFWEDGAVIRHVIRKEPFGIFDFVIPAGESNYSASKDYVLEDDSYILTFLPHMHLRGKAAKFEITRPDGAHEVLLYVPQYDFDWQHEYRFREPVFAPAGSKVTMTLWWDNSDGNPHNPDPTVDVVWGTPTWDEMGYGFMDFVKAEPVHYVVGEEIPSDVPPLLVSPLSPAMHELPIQVLERMQQRGEIRQQDLDQVRQMRRGQ
jgi:hypothetical protein